MIQFIVGRGKGSILVYAVERLFCDLVAHQSSEGTIEELSYFPHPLSASSSKLVQGPLHSSPLPSTHAAALNVHNHPGSKNTFPSRSRPGAECRYHNIANQIDIYRARLKGGPEVA